MLITRETDYALRILRALCGGERVTVGEIARQQLVPQQFAYKIAKKLEKAGLVRITRGTDGGCQLAADLHEVSLYDLMQAMDEDGFVVSCLEPGYACQWREQHQLCRVHQHLARIQQRLDRELQENSLWDILEKEEC